MIKLTRNSLVALILWMFLLAVFIFIPACRIYFQLSLKLVCRLIKSRNGTRYILHWVPTWSDSRLYLSSKGFEAFKNCPIKDCFATHNRELIPVEDFDAILFHPQQNSKVYYSKPSVRGPHQRYVFVSMEPPTDKYPNVLQRYRWFYNWTMTYRADSDIVVPFGYVTKADTNYTMPTKEFVNKKSLLAAWIASKCSSWSKREFLVNNLQKLIKVDIYGDCGDFTCSKGSGNWETKCLNLIEPQYKFYLAFENSYCKDYVTEELYNALKMNLVPVVYGYIDYEKIAPPNSVIVSEKFSSTQQLVDYLLFLDKNPEEYLKFFEWKKNYSVEMHKYSPMCQLCKMLHDPKQPQNIYQDVFGWWSGKNNNYCKRRLDLPNISFPIP